MAEPTLKDVLKVLAELRSEMATKSDLAKVEASVTKVEASVTKVEASVTKVEAKVDAHRAETKKGFADLDAELTKHAEVHKELEIDVASVKRRPIRTAARAPRRRPAK